MMKRLIPIILILLYTADTHAQSPAWQWARYGDNNGGNALAAGVSRDAAGNIYTVGQFSGSIAFDNVSYTAAGTANIYLLKYSPAGSLLWSRAVLGTGIIYSYAIAADSNGDVYIAGSFTKTAWFGSRAVVSAGGKDIFLLKYSSDGDLIWANTHGTIYDDAVDGGIAIDSRHNILIDGYFCGATNSPPLHETINFGNYVLTSNGDEDMFLVKCDSSGQVIWARNPGFKFSEHAVDLALDKSDNIYITGNFDQRMYFGAITLNSISSGFVAADNFVAKYDSAGTVLWAKAIGGYKAPAGSSGGTVYSRLIAVDTGGNPIVGGNYSSCAVRFGSYDLPTRSPYSGTYDMWFARFSASGIFQWANSAGGSSPDYLRGMVTDNEGSIYITGEYGEDCVFDNDTPYIPVNNPGSYMFVAKYSNAGGEQWVQTAGDIAGATSFDVAVVKPDELIAVGQFYGGGSIQFGRSSAINSGTIGNGFVAKMSRNGLSALQPAAAGFGISPNPASSSLLLKMSEPGRYSTFTLSDMLGRQSVQGTLKATAEQVIRLPSLPGGVYYLTLSGKTDRATQKISIQ